MKNYIIKTLNGMAYGLFATLIVGVIVQQFGTLINSSFIRDDLYNLLASLMGVGIALGIGVVLKKDGLFLVMLAVVGAISTKFYLTTEFTVVSERIPGNPLTAYLVTVVSIVVLENVFKKKTPVDIIIIPIITIIVAVGLTLIFSLPLKELNEMINLLLVKAINIMPIVMVIIISVSMGMLLTAPVSSAAIAHIIFVSSDPSLVNDPLIQLAAGAAVVGTSIQMIGFAIQSRRDNKIGSLISIAIGTSMLQFKNIVKKPIIWLPTILASAIVAPITYFLGFISSKAGGGMGTSGLVGPLESLRVMGYSWQSFLSLAIIIVIGGLLVYVFDKILYKKGFIELGDLSLDEELK